MLRHLGHSQQTILESLLTSSGPLTIDKLGENLGISKNAVYQHIGALERTGLVEKSCLNRTGGRPSQSYILSHTGQNLFPKHYALISSMLVGLMKEDLGSDRLNEYLVRIGEHMGEEFMGEVRGKTLEERLPIVINILSKLGYAPEDANAQPHGSENGLAADDGIAIRAHNCVFHDLANEHQEVCALDISLVSKLLGSKINLTGCMAKGDVCCTFKIAGQNSKR
jgi:DeoR family transcriptional regulator, suf operon transcriptional repressor